MSKSAFAVRFAELMGTKPKEYVTRWRMTQAELMLKDPVTSVAHAARSNGYESEAAFRRAFKRLFGIGPRKARLKGK
jgi:AraC family transcriptional activator of mtrCDE